MNNIKLPAEFQSGNSVPVERATITRQRMAEILAEAIEADRKRRGELVVDAEMLTLRIAGTFCNHLDTALDQSRVMAAAREIAGFLDPQPAEPSSELMRLMPEVLAALKCSGLNVSLAEDVERTLLAQPTEPMNTDSAGYTLGPISDGGIDPRNEQSEKMKVPSEGDHLRWALRDCGVSRSDSGAFFDELALGKLAALLARYSKWAGGVA